MSRVRGNNTDRRMQARFEARQERREQARWVTTNRNEGRLEGHAPRATPHQWEDTEWGHVIGGNQGQRTEAASIPAYNSITKQGGLLGADSLPDPWPYTPRRAGELCRGLVLQLNPDGNELFEPLPVDDDLNLVVLNTPALCDNRGSGLACLILTVRNGYVTGDAWVNLNPDFDQVDEALGW